MARPDAPEREVYFTDTWRGPRQMHGLLYPNLQKDPAEVTGPSATAKRPSQVVATVPVEALFAIGRATSSAIDLLTTGAVGTRRYRGRNPSQWNVGTALPKRGPRTTPGKRG